MFDIGFAELLLIGVVGLLVVGPEQLPGAVRTVLAWVNRFRRSFDQIRTEVRRELHNDEIMQKLKAESRQLEQQVRDTTQSVEQEIQADVFGIVFCFEEKGFFGSSESSFSSGNAEDEGYSIISSDPESFIIDLNFSFTLSYVISILSKTLVIGSLSFLRIQRSK